VFAWFAAVLLVLLNQLAGYAAIKDMSEYLPDDYLGTEFKWSMVLYLPDVKDSLDYKGSTLHPLTKVSVRFNQYPSVGKVEKPYEVLVSQSQYWNARATKFNSWPVVWRNNTLPAKERKVLTARSITNALVRVIEGTMAA
jgi:hypothetical protein